MIKIEKIKVSGLDAAIRGMRNPFDSWDKSDSKFEGEDFSIGENDLKLMRRLFKAGPEHRKFLRMIHLTADLTAPMYWWKEYDTYKVGTVANSCSTMHKLGSRYLTKDDFSTDGSVDDIELILQPKINLLNLLIDELKEKDGDERQRIWRTIVMMLPMCYNQKRTIDLNLEVVYTIIRQRENHKLIEWRQLVKIFKALPIMSLLLEETGEKE